MSSLTRDVRERLARENIERARSLKTENTEQAEEAMQYLTIALTYEPFFVNALLPRAHLAARLSHFDVAITDFSIAIQLEEYGFDRRRLAAIYGSRGNVFRKMNKITESIIDLTRAVEVEPDNGTWLYELGVTYLMQGSRTLAQHFFASSLGDKVTGRMTDNIRFRALTSLGTCKLNAGDINGAVTVLMKGLEIQETASLHNLLGIAHFKREEYRISLQNFQRALELDGVKSEYHIHIGVCNFQLGIYTEALKHFEDAVLKGTKQAVHHFFRGNTALVLGMYPQAIMDINEAISLDPSLEAHYYSKALAFIAEDRHNEAQVELQTALELSPTFRTAWVQSGLLHFLQGELFAALRCFSQALDLEEADYLVHECIGLVYCNLKYFDLAAESFTRCINLQPKNPIFFFRRGAALLEHNDIHGAYLDLNKAVEVFEYREAPALHSLSVVLSKLNKHTDALEYAKVAVSLNKNNYRYLLQRANCYYNIGDYSSVITDASTIIQQLEHESAELYYLRAKSYYAMREFNKTSNDLLLAASLQPLLHESADFCYALGVAYLHSMKNQVESESAFTKAIQLHSQPPSYFYDARAKVRQQLGNAAGTLEDLNIVLKNDENNPEALLRRAFANKALKQYEAAARDFEKVRTLEIGKELLESVTYEKFFAIEEIPLNIEE